MQSVLECVYEFQGSKLYLCESIMLTKTMTLDYEVVHVYLQSDMF